MQTQQKIYDFGAGLRIEISSWLICQQKIWLTYQCASNSTALTLPPQKVNGEDSVLFRSIRFETEAPLLS